MSLRFRREGLGDVDVEQVIVNALEMDEQREESKNNFKYVEAHKREVGGEYNS